MTGFWQPGGFMTESVNQEWVNHHKLTIDLPSSEVIATLHEHLRFSGPDQLYAMVALWYTVVRNHEFLGKFMDQYGRLRR